MDINRPRRVKAGYQFQPAGEHDIISVEIPDQVLVALGSIGTDPVGGRDSESPGLTPNPAVKMISDNRTYPSVQNWRAGPRRPYQRLKSGATLGFGPGSKNQNIW